jgi:hypothetical protein
MAPAVLASVWMLAAPPAFAGSPPIASLFLQVSPDTGAETAWKRSVGQRKAVLLIEGLTAHPISSARVEQPMLTTWQKPDGMLVKALGADADVFAFAYSQNAPVDAVPAETPLCDRVEKLRSLGYRDVTLLGFSAGGIVARQFVEDFPKAGVTKVVQVCPPNGGSGWSKADFAVRPNQVPFLHSLTKEARRAALEQRASKHIPDDVEFVCVVGMVTKSIPGDGVVPSDSQWTSDLQAQGVPAVRVAGTHLTVMKSSDTVAKIAEVVRDKQPRWGPAEVEIARRLILKHGEAGPVAKPKTP